MLRLTTFILVIGSAAAFNAPIMARRAAPRARPHMVSLDTLPGKYALGGVFDPLGLGEKGDLIWLREAELKHGRIAMLAVVGFIVNDLGFHFPGAQFQGVSSLAAHDVMLKVGRVCAAYDCVGFQNLADPVTRRPLDPSLSFLWAPRRRGTCSRCSMP